MPKLGDMDSARVGQLGALAGRRLKTGMDQGGDVPRAWLR
jgi:hypothetical protein